MNSKSKFKDYLIKILCKIAVYLLTICILGVNYLIQWLKTEIDSRQAYIDGGLPKNRKYKIKEKLNKYEIVMK